jgi:hypothetical protein
MISYLALLTQASGNPSEQALHMTFGTKLCPMLQSGCVGWFTLDPERCIAAYYRHVVLPRMFATLPKLKNGPLPSCTLSPGFTAVNREGLLCIYVLTHAPGTIDLHNCSDVQSSSLLGYFPLVVFRLGGIPPSPRYCDRDSHTPN